MNSETEKPDWWRENEKLREQMDLPAYQPARFHDGVYLHEVINRLEQKHGIELLLIGRNTRYGEDWEISMDGNRIGVIGRHRDNNSNTVYELDSEVFREIVESNIEKIDSNE